MLQRARIAVAAQAQAAIGQAKSNVIDLTDVYMTFFLPTEQVALGAEARLVLDAAPQ